MKVKSGDTVQIHYNGSLDDGTIVESTIAGDPLLFTVGQGKVIPGIESAILKMEEGDTKTVRISPEDAYGHYYNNAVTAFEKTMIPPHIELKIGMRLNIKTIEGKDAVITVTDITDNTVPIDSNHPLAGKELTFEIHLLKIL